MTDLERFEAGFERRLRAFAADVPVAPIDAEAIAGRVVKPRRIPSDVRIALLAAALFVAFVIAALVLAGGSPKPPALVALPSTAVAGTLERDLAGTWIADVPADMVFSGEGSQQRMGLVFDPGSNQYAFLQVGGSSLERFAATTEWLGPDSVRFVTRGVSEGVEVAGSPVAGCAARDAGTYRVQRSADGLRLTLTAIDDVCAARSAVLVRTWMRSVAAPSRGGSGVVDAFDPLFTVELPDGIYTASRTTDWQVIHDQVHGDEFIAAKDPQGFLDPCDISRGRYEIPHGAQAWVDYFAQLRGFTTDSVEDLRRRRARGQAPRRPHRYRPELSVGKSGGVAAQERDLRLAFVPPPGGHGLHGRRRASRHDPAVPGPPRPGGARRPGHRLDPIPGGAPVHALSPAPAGPTLEGGIPWSQP